ncbi:MAG: transcriptional regulator [Planctomycetes bacterium]|jgi:DNA-binding MarR family transcriptional regulator|nr:transcriptional regulator [Planctomycetota bacterium]MCL4730758.1 transcriptional regulator [Planctomycetota bacterium]
MISPALALDPLIHERLRLAILAALGSHGRLTFNELKGLTEATDGNLSTHTQKLETAGYIQAAKGMFGGRSKTTYEITPGGRAALAAYLDALEKLLGKVRGN